MLKLGQGSKYPCPPISPPLAPDGISTQYGEREKGVVYPGDVEVVVQVNGSTICSGVTAADTSCTVDLPRDVYNISITQSNDIGSTVNSSIFDSKSSDLNLSLLICKFEYLHNPISILMQRKF